MVDSIVRGSVGSRLAICCLATSAGMATAGCYGYYSAPPEALERGEEIRVVLSDDGMRRLSPDALVGNQPVVEGDLVDLATDSVALSVWIGAAYRGTPFYSAHQTISVPRDEVLGFERRTLSRARTTLATIGVLGGIYVLIKGVKPIFAADPADDGSGTEPPDEEQILFQVPIPFLR